MKARQYVVEDKWFIKLCVCVRMHMLPVYIHIYIFIYIKQYVKNYKSVHTSDRAVALGYNKIIAAVFNRSVTEHTNKNTAGTTAAFTAKRKASVLFLQPPRFSVICNVHATQNVKQTHLGGLGGQQSTSDRGRFSTRSQGNENGWCHRLFNATSI